MQNKETNIDEYISFIKDNKQYIDIYANLDVIGNAEETYKNQKYMEANGVNPLPVFHTTKEDEKWLKKYIDEGYEYICLGGMAGGSIPTPIIMNHLDILFSKYICHNDGNPKVKVHGFGLTSFKLMERYPWYSVDSTSWLQGGIYGAIYMPPYEKEQFLWYNKPIKIFVSEKSNCSQFDDYYFTMNKYKKEIVDFYLKMMGYKIEELSTNYVIRDCLNIDYYLKLEEQFSKEHSFSYKDKRRLF